MKEDQIMKKILVILVSLFALFLLGSAIMANEDAGTYSTSYYQNCRRGDCLNYGSRCDKDHHYTHHDNRHSHQNHHQYSWCQNKNY